MSVCIENRLRLGTSVRKSSELPLFAKGAIQLGRSLYLSSVGGDPRLVVVVVPVRDYFAPFLALGAAEAAFKASTSALPSVGVGDTVLALLDDGTYYTAIYEGDEAIIGGKPVPQVKLGLIGDKAIGLKSDRVVLIPAPQKTMKLSGFKPSTLPDRILQAMFALGVTNPATLLSVHETAASIVGTRATLSEEMDSVPFSLSPWPKDSIALSEVLSVARSSLTSPMVTIVSSTGNEPIPGGSPLTILDGVNVVLRHGIDTSRGSTVAVIEATSPISAIDLADVAISNATTFLEADADWNPMKHASFDSVEWSVHRIGGHV